MTLAQQYCGECFRLFDAASDTCPYCGCAMAQLSEREYDQKLLHALEHPLADIRMRAVIALGLCGRPEAATPLAECALRYPTDVVQGLEIINSLSKIWHNNSNGIGALKRLVEEHPAHVVREAAAGVWARIVQR